jgi:hypothetical protein
VTWYGSWMVLYQALLNWMVVLVARRGIAVEPPVAEMSSEPAAIPERGHAFVAHVFTLQHASVPD